MEVQAPLDRLRERRLQSLCKHVTLGVRPSGLLCLLPLSSIGEAQRVVRQRQDRYLACSE